jgi:hypothetical protein
MVRVTLRELSSDITDGVEDKEAHKTKRSVLGRARKALQRVDNDLVSGGTSVEASDAHETRNLAGDNIDGRAGHETRYGCGILVE